MSKIFSFVRFETNTGLTHTDYIAGIPDLNDIKGSRAYKKTLQLCEDIEFIQITLNSYCYGSYKGIEPTTTKDLEYISSLKNFIQSNEVDWLQNNKFVIYPQYI